LSNLIQADLKDKILVIRPKKEEVGLDEAEELKTIAGEWKEKKIRSAIIDFSGISYMSSPFLGAMIEVLKSFREKGIRFALAGLNSQVLGILRSTNLDRVIQIFNTLPEACEAMK